MSHFCPTTRQLHAWEQASAPFTYVCPNCRAEVGQAAVEGPPGCKAADRWQGPLRACGRPVVRMNRCQECIDEEVARLRQDAGEYAVVVSELRTRISELTGEA